MIKRPLNSRFGDAVRDERKFTTIRDSAWPIGRPIMLYHWEGAPYRSPHVDVAVIEVIDVRPITIARTGINGEMVYSYTAEGDERLVHLWKCEGFNSREDMDAWFKALVKPGKPLQRHLHRFLLLPF